MSQPGAATDQSLEAGFREILATNERAWNTHDPKLLLTLFTDDIDFVNVVGLHHQTKAALEQELTHLHTTFMRNSQVRMMTHDARELGSGVAVAHVHWEMTGVDKVPGWNIREPRRGVLTYVLVKRDGKWKITAAHNTDVLPLPMPGQAKEQP